MNLPQIIPMNLAELVGNDEGYKVHIYTNSEYGITGMYIRPDANSKWLREFSITAIPNRLFHSLRSLRSAVAELEPENSEE